MPEIIRIDMPKGVEEGQTSLSPESPSRSNVTSPTISRKGAIIAGTAVMAGAQIYQGYTKDLAEGGNEEMANDLKNLAVAGRVILGAAATSGVSLIAEGGNALINSVFTTRSVNRQNRARDYERSMKGAENTYMNGGGW